MIKAKCPKCSKELNFEFPYNVDLFRNDVIVVCSKCKQKIRLVFEDELFGAKLQMVFRK